MTVIYRQSSARPLTVAALLPLLIAGCAAPQQTQKPVDDFALKFPAAVLGQDMVHSPGGDMTARIPQGWVTMEVERLEAPRVFSVACDPEYTMSLIFCEVPVDNSIRNSFELEGMTGLIDASFMRRQRNSGGRLQKARGIEEVTVNSRKFGLYNYTTDSTGSMTRVAVFFTNTHLYECAITHLPFSENELPSAEVLDEVHRIVLASVEW